jgi:hypothetical protein
MRSRVVLSTWFRENAHPGHFRFPNHFWFGKMRIPDTSLLEVFENLGSLQTLINQKCWERSLKHFWFGKMRIPDTSLLEVFENLGSLQTLLV